MILTLASVGSNTSAVLAGSVANRRTVSTVVALVAFAALKHQPLLIDVNVLGDPSDVHLGPGATESGRPEAPASCLVLVRLVRCHLSRHCVPGGLSFEHIVTFPALTFLVWHKHCPRPSQWRRCCRKV